MDPCLCLKAVKMYQTLIESLLEKEIGLSADAVGPKAIADAVRLRIDTCGLTGMKAYFDRLRTSREERERLIEAVVIPETWFFRNRKAFDFLVRHVKEEWLPVHKNDLLRVLSVPCSTGEEPYSIAMALSDAGIKGEHFLIDAADISEIALCKARSALYSPGSFRGDDLLFRERCFEPKGDSYHLDPRIRKMVSFLKGNPLDNRFLIGHESYDIIFCRNLLIYQTSRARRRVIDNLDRLLTRTGLIFVGHAERPIAIDFGLVGVHHIGAFACRKAPQEVRNVSKPPDLLSHPHQERPFKKGSSIVSQDKAHQPLIKQGRQDENETQNDRLNLFNEARRLADLGSLTSAFKLCADFIEENPTHVQASFLMGLICEALDKREKAEEYFNRTIYLEPNHLDALNHLAFLMELHGDEERVVRLRKRAQRVSHNKG